MFLRNVGMYLQVYTVSQPRRATWTKWLRIVSEGRIGVNSVEPSDSNRVSGY
jgi:hypothetical protein